MDDRVFEQIRKLVKQAEDSESAPPDKEDNPEDSYSSGLIGEYQGLMLLAGLLGGGALGAAGGNLGARLLTAGQGKKAFADVERARKILTRAGGALGAAAGGYLGSRGLDFDTAGSLMKSLYTKNYWRKNPEQLQKVLDKHERRLRNVEFSPSYDLSEIGKQGSEVDLSGFNRAITVDESSSIIDEDPYLNPLNKEKVNYIMYGADEDEDDWISPYELSKSALRLGVGFVPAYLGGRVAGSLLRLPKSTKKRLSLTGGLAGALANSGLISGE